MYLQVFYKMGIKERRLKDRAALRQKILDAANNLFLEVGYEKTTMRKIAETIDYNPATIYFYFKNKEEIFYTLQKIAFESFYEAFHQVIKQIPDPAERLTKMGRAYINFALENPAYYDLMFIMRQPMNALPDDNWKIGEHNFNLLKETVEACMQEGYLKESDPETMAMMIWSSVHGIVSLYICKRLQKFEDYDLDFMIREAFTLFMALLLQHKAS